MRSQPRQGLFKGSGVLSQQAKTDFRWQRWKSVLSICIYKRPACQSCAEFGTNWASSVFVPTNTQNRLLAYPPVVGGSRPQTPFRRISFCGCAPFRRFFLPPPAEIFWKTTRLAYQHNCKLSRKWKRHFSKSVRLAEPQPA